MAHLPFGSRLLFVPIFLAPVACGTTVETAGTGGNGTGGAPTSTGSGSATGGAGGDATTTGSGTASTGSMMSTSSSSGTGVDCSALGGAYQAALNDAAKCNGCKNFDGCVNGPVFNDVC